MQQINEYRARVEPDGKWIVMHHVGATAREVGHGESLTGIDGEQEARLCIEADKRLRARLESQRAKTKTFVVKA